MTRSVTALTLAPSVALDGTGEAPWRVAAEAPVGG